MTGYNVLYDSIAFEELRQLRLFDRRKVLGAIDRYLFDNPKQVTKSSVKKLEPPAIADYRLRIGDYRVFYNVDEENRNVHVIAIRYKGRLTTDEVTHGSRH